MSARRVKLVGKGRFVPKGTSKGKSLGKGKLRKKRTKSRYIRSRSIA